MTSANVTQYTIRKINTKEEVGEHRQHHYCKSHWEDLLKFTPLEEHEIHSWGLDEEEEEWHDTDDNNDDLWYNLKDFLLARKIIK